MADKQVVEGDSFKFEVVAKNKFGKRVKVSNAAVTLDPAEGTVSVDADGTNGVFTAGSAATVLKPSAGGVTGADFAVEVTPDLAVATVAIQPVDTSDATVATVAVQPAAAPAVPS
jgi:hypothetical protein